MTQEEKQLLLKDLCARLPYGVKVHINSPIEGQNSMELFDVNLDSEHIGIGNEKWAFKAIPIIDDEAKVVKPYLRPMSSMTQEECMELSRIKANYDEVEAWKYIKTPVPLVIANIKQFDFFHSHHLDWRDLIRKGLALEAPEGMYNIKEK